MSTRRWVLLLTALTGVGVLGYFGRGLLKNENPSGFASCNGRIEAVEIDIATKTPGRLAAIRVNEGDFVATGDVIAEMDTAVLAAQLREAEANFRRTKTSVDAARSSVAQRESEKEAAESLVAQREAELDLAKKNLARAEQLSGTNAISKEEVDNRAAAFYGAKAAISAAKANVAGANAAIATARSQVIQAEAAVVAAQAQIDRLHAEIEDSVLKSPRDGRVQYRVAQPGEVLNAGGKAVNLVDLGDVYMTFFLPTAQAGRVRLGAEVRVVLDAAPEYVIPAHVSFVADVAQFTPKTVETAEDRSKLMFRIKARIDPELLRKYIRSVKTGLPGMAHVRLDPGAAWPTNLEVRLPR